MSDDEDRSLLLATFEIPLPRGLTLGKVAEVLEHLTGQIARNEDYRHRPAVPYQEVSGVSLREEKVDAVLTGAMPFVLRFDEMEPALIQKFASLIAQAEQDRRQYRDR
jgi:hypothetical protein